MSSTDLEFDAYGLISFRFSLGFFLIDLSFSQKRAETCIWSPRQSERESYCKKEIIFTDWQFLPTFGSWLLWGQNFRSCLFHLACPHAGYSVTKEGMLLWKLGELVLWNIVSRPWAPNLHPPMKTIFSAGIYSRQISKLSEVGFKEIGIADNICWSVSSCRILSHIFPISFMSGLESWLIKSQGYELKTHCYWVYTQHIVSLILIRTWPWEFSFYGLIHFPWKKLGAMGLRGNHTAVEVILAPFPLALCYTSLPWTSGKSFWVMPAIPSLLRKPNGWRVRTIETFPPFRLSIIEPLYAG